MMYGAITGDILGSRFEFGNKKRNDYSKVPLFHKRDHFTDDTVLTLAVADWLLHDIKNHYYDDEALKELLAKQFVRWTKNYNKYKIAYGISYSQWYLDVCKTGVYIPYNSYGNGSAMRVSPIAWYFDTLEETLRFAKISADVTHNHPDGEKGAMCIAASCYLARKGKSKEYIKQYVIRAFGYIELIKNVKELRRGHEWNCTCKNTVPQAVASFLESTDFESAIKIAISFGGDSDTIAAMAGSIAECYYGGVPESILDYVKTKLPEDALAKCEEFSNAIKNIE